VFNPWAQDTSVLALYLHDKAALTAGNIKRMPLGGGSGGTAHATDRLMVAESGFIAFVRWGVDEINHFEKLRIPGCYVTNSLE